MNAQVLERNKSWDLLKRIESSWTLALALGVLFFISCQVSDFLVFQKFGITSYWPGSAIFIFSICFTQPKSWPKIVACIFLGNFAFNTLIKNLPPLHGVAFASTNLIEALAARYLIKDKAREIAELRTLKQFLRFLRDWVILAPIAGAATGALAVVWAFPAAQYSAVFPSWWMADSLGVLTLMPVMFAFMNKDFASFSKDFKGGVFEFFALALIYFIGSFYFLGSDIGQYFQPSVYVLPVFFWTFLRFGNAALLLLQVILTATVLYFAARGVGPFARPEMAGWERQYSSHIYLIVVICSFMIFSRIQKESNLLSDFAREVTDRVGAGLAVLDSNNQTVWSNRSASQATVVSVLNQVKDSMMPSPFLDQESTQQDPKILMVAQDGGKRWLQLMLDRMQNSPFGENATLLSFYDVTALKEVQQNLIHEIDSHKGTLKNLETSKAEALQASRAKSEFLSRMSHEIRNPLNSILGLKQLLRMTQLSVEQDKYLRTFEDATENLIALVNDLLDLSKIEVGRVDIDFTLFKPADILQGAVALLQNSANAKGIGLHAQIFANSDIEVMGDPLKVRQILLNLISNAIKFTEKGDVVAGVRIVKKTNEITFFVKDTGIGMSAEQLDMLFTPYHQITADPQLKKLGVGLGLAISRGLAVAMKGGINVLSVPDAGSTFSFYLPLTLPGESDHARVKGFGSDSWISARSKSVSLQVLVVDDRPENRLLLKFFLEKMGHLVQEADDGDTAVEAFLNGTFDLILMDLNMPRMNGEEALREIKKQILPSSGYFPICVAVSANASLEDIERSREVGFYDHMVKPVNLRSLQILLEKIVAIHAKFNGVGYEAASS